MLLDILLRNSLLESNGIPTQCSLRKKREIIMRIKECFRERMDRNVTGFQEEAKVRN